MGEDGGMRLFFLGLALMTLVGAFLRAIHLDTTLGFDETVTVRRFVEGGTPSIFALYDGYGSTNNHVLNSLLSLASVRTFGEEVWALRLPSYLFGVLTIPLVGVLSRNLLRDFTAAWVAAFLVMLSPILIGYSPACRGYAPLLFFALLSVWGIQRVVDRGELSKLPVVALALFATGWSHMSGLVFLAACGLFLAVFLAMSFRKEEFLVAGRGPVLFAMVALGVATVALVIWYSRASLILQDVQSRVTQGEFVDPSLAGLRSVHTDNSLVSWVEHTGKKFFGTSGALLPLTAPFMLLGFPIAWKRNRRSGWLLLCTVLFPPAALLAGRLMPFPRYFLFVQPFALILAAVGLCWAGRRLAEHLPLGFLRKPALTTALLVLFFQGLSFPLLRENLAGPGAKVMGIEWNARALTDRLEAEVEPEDIVVSFPLPRERTEWREWGFSQTYEFHEENQIAPLLAQPLSADGLTTRRVWYATPNREIRDFEYLPTGFEPRLAAEFQSCYLHTDEVELGELRRQDIPSFQAEGAEAWTFECPFDNVSFALDVSDPEPRVSFTVEQSGADAQFVSKPLEVSGGRVVELQAEIAAVQPDGMRPFGRVGFHFYDEAGELIQTRSRSALLWEDLRPRAGWSFVRLTTVVPRSARTMKLFLALSLGNHTGCTVSFRLPKLLGS